MVLIFVFPVLVQSGWSVMFLRIALFCVLGIPVFSFQDWDGGGVEPEIPVRTAEPGKTRWYGDLDLALAEAKLRQAPIVIVMGEDTSATLDYMLAKVFLTQSYTKALRGSVALIAMKGLSHPKEDKETRAGKEMVCKLFQIPCEEHDETYQVLFHRFVHRSFWNPLLLILNPEGNEVLRLEGTTHAVSRLEDEIVYARKIVEAKFGKAMTDSTYRKLMGFVERSRKALGEGRGGAALEELGKLAKTSKLTQGFKDLIEQERGKIDVRGRDQLRMAIELSQKGETREALSRMKKIAREFRGLPVEKLAADALKKMDRQK